MSRKRKMNWTELKAISSHTEPELRISSGWLGVVVASRAIRFASTLALNPDAHAV